MDFLWMRAHFYFKLQQNEAHMGIRAKGNNVCNCNMAGSDGFHLNSRKLFPNIILS